MKHLSFLLVFLMACGGGGGEGGGDAGSGDISAFTGQWLQGQCSVLGGGAESGRMMIRATVESGGDVRFEQALVQYVGDACDGNGTTPPNGFANLGTIDFEASERSGHVEMRRGTWSQPNSMTSRVLWTLEHGERLCILADTDPTSFPSASSVASYLDVLDDDFCYTRP